jgi:neutral ceramidase
MLKVGIAETNITPEPGLRMAGMLNPPKAEGARWDLMGRIMVFDDGAHCAAMIALDLLMLMPSTVAELRQALAAGTGLAPEDILITCNHTHRAPYTAAIMDEVPDFAYLDLVRARLVEAMARAWAARQPARLRAGRSAAPGWTFNRRPMYNTPWGVQVGTQGPRWVAHFAGMEGPDDVELRALLVESPKGEALGGFANYSCHTTVMGGEPYYSADYSGPLTEELVARRGGVFGFLQGCAGNQWVVSMAHEGPMTEWGPDYNARMGRALADKTDEALANGQAVTDGQVRTARTILRIPQRRARPEQVTLAKEYLERRAAEMRAAEASLAEIPWEQRPRNEAADAWTLKAYGHPYTFYNNGHAVEDWFARETIGMWEWQRRVGTRDLLEEVEVQVITVGDLAFVGYPGEMFAEFGVRTRAGSPFAHTFVAELSNGWHGYIPTVEAFAHGGYECRFGNVSRLIPEAGDRMVDTALGMLMELAQ